MIRHLFAYGTLQHGHAPQEIAAAVASLKPVACGTVTGVLYDLGRYPGAVLAPALRAEVHGTVLQLPDQPDFLRALDAYEEYEPGAQAASLFVRVPCAVKLETGGMLDCWIYVYNRPLATARRIEDGRWRK